MTINYMNNTIEMSKSEAKAAGKYDSEKFKELQTLKAAEPTFRVVIVKSTTKKRDHFKGLDFKYMESYIQSHDEDGSIIAEFYELRGLDEKGQKKEFAATASYGVIKMWFLARFPEIKAMSANIDGILDMVRKDREVQRDVA